jgi:hypothetical protein
VVFSGWFGVCNLGLANVLVAFWLWCAELFSTSVHEGMLVFLTCSCGRIQSVLVVDCAGLLGNNVHPKLVVRWLLWFMISHILAGFLEFFGALF